MAVIRVRDANRVAYHASTLIGAIVTFVADSDERCRADVGIAHDAFPVALFAQTSDGDAGHLPAHDEVRVVFRHDDDDAMTKTSAFCRWCLVEKRNAIQTRRRRRRRRDDVNTSEDISSLSSFSSSFSSSNWKTEKKKKKKRHKKAMGMWHRATTTTTTKTTTKTTPGRRPIVVPKTTKRKVFGSRTTTTRRRRRTTTAAKSSSKQHNASEKDDDDDDEYTTTTTENFEKRNRRAILTAAACVVSMRAWERGPTAAYEDEKTVPAHQTEDMPPVAYKNYTDYDRGFSMKVPRDWQMDAPNGVLEREFHPRAEYGGRRCTVIVSTVGKVDENISSSNDGVPKLRDLGAEEYKSAEKLGKTRANDFAPLDGATGGAKAATFLVKSEEKEDGSLYFYEWRSQALLNFHFWEVAVLGPGPKGAGRKLGRRDIITVKCQMPEDGMTPGDVEIFETITQSLKLLPEEEMDVNAEF